MKFPHFRFRSVISMASAKLSIRTAAVLLATGTLVSSLLGIFRDRLLNSLYLDTYPTGIDAYTAAFTIPEFMFFILTSGALAVSFIPVFNQRLVAGNKKSAWELTSSLLNFMALVTLVASVLIMIFADPLVRHVVGPGLDEPGTILAINMMRVIAINPFLFSITTILTSVQQAVGRFVFYSLAPILYNVGILIGISWFTNGIDLFGIHLFDGGIMGVALGVVFGAVLQLIVALVGLFGLGFDYNFKISWKNQGFRSVLRLLPARSLDQGIDYVNNIVSTNLSSRMGAGALRSFQQASSLHAMPVNLIGVAISTAYFPKLTEDIAKNDEKAYRATFRRALRTIIWITLPVVVVAFFGRGYVVSFIKNGGDSMISGIFGTFIIAILARSMFHIVSRSFYARQDTRTPFLTSVISIGGTILLSILFYNLGFGIEGLGWAQSIGAVFEIIILISILQRRSKNQILNREFLKGFLKMLFATIITSCVAYSMTKFLPLMTTDNSFLQTFPKFCVISICSIITYCLASYFLGLPEIQPISDKLKHILFRNMK